MYFKKYILDKNKAPYLGFMRLCLGEVFYLYGKPEYGKILYVKIGPTEMIKYKDLKKFNFDKVKFSDLLNLMFSIRCITNGMFLTIPIGIVNDNLKIVKTNITTIEKKSRKVLLEKQGIIHFSFLTKRNVSLKKYFKEVQKMSEYELAYFRELKKGDTND